MVEDSAVKLEVKVATAVLLAVTVDVGISDELSLVELVRGPSEVNCEVADTVSMPYAEVTPTVVVGVSMDIEELETPFVVEGKIDSCDDNDTIVVDAATDAVDETSNDVEIDMEGTSVVTGRVGMGRVVW